MVTANPHFEYTSYQFEIVPTAGINTPKTFNLEYKDASGNWQPVEGTLKNIDGVVFSKEAGDDAIPMEIEDTEGDEGETLYIYQFKTAITNVSEFRITSESYWTADDNPQYRYAVHYNAQLFAQFYKYASTITATTTDEREWQFEATTTVAESTSTMKAAELVGYVTHDKPTIRASGKVISVVDAKVHVKLDDDTKRFTMSGLHILNPSDTESYRDRLTRRIAVTAVTNADVLNTFRVEPMYPNVLNNGDIRLVDKFGSFVSDLSMNLVGDDIHVTVDPAFELSGEIYIQFAELEQQRLVTVHRDTMADAYDGVEGEDMFRPGKVVLNMERTARFEKAAQADYEGVKMHDVKIYEVKQLPTKSTITCTRKVETRNGASVDVLTFSGLTGSSKKIVVSAMDFENENKGVQNMYGIFTGNTPDKPALQLSADTIDSDIQLNHEVYAFESSHLEERIHTVQVPHLGGDHADKIRLIGLDGGNNKGQSKTTQYVMTGTHYDVETNQDVTIAIGFTISTKNMGSKINIVDKDSMIDLQTGDAVVSHSRNGMRFVESMELLTTLRDKHHPKEATTTTIAVAKSAISSMSGNKYNLYLDSETKKDIGKLI